VIVRQCSAGREGHVLQWANVGARVISTGLSRRCEAKAPKVVVLRLFARLPLAPGGFPTHDLDHGAGDVGRVGVGSQEDVGRR